jgi:hypothetical protein
VFNTRLPPPHKILRTSISYLFEKSNDNLHCSPVIVAERSKAWTVFARSDAVILGLNPTHGMDLWHVYVFILCLCLCCPMFR